MLGRAHRRLAFSRATQVWALGLGLAWIWEGLTYQAPVFSGTSLLLLTIVEVNIWIHHYREPSDVTAPEHLSLRSPVTTQKCSPSHITVGEEQMQRDSAIVSRSGIGNELSSQPGINPWRLSHVADNQSRSSTFCTATLRMRFLESPYLMQTRYRRGVRPE